MDVILDKIQLFVLNMISSNLVRDAHFDRTDQKFAKLPGYELVNPFCSRHSVVAIVHWRSACLICEVELRSCIRTRL